MKAFALPGNDHCAVKLLLLVKYLSLLPSDASYFHMRAEDQDPPNQSMGSFAKQQIGINALKAYYQSCQKNLGYRLDIQIIIFE